MHNLGSILRCISNPLPTSFPLLDEGAGRRRPSLARLRPRSSFHLHRFDSVSFVLLCRSMRCCRPDTPHRNAHREKRGTCEPAMGGKEDAVAGGAIEDPLLRRCARYGHVEGRGGAIGRWRAGEGRRRIAGRPCSPHGASAPHEGEGAMVWGGPDGANEQERPPPVEELNDWGGTTVWVGPGRAERSRAE
jgi:hypothetical protein